MKVNLNDISQLPGEAASTDGQATAGGTTFGMTLVRMLLLFLWTAYSWRATRVPMSDLDDLDGLTAVSFFVAAPALYFLPAIEGALRKQPNMLPIVLMNTLLGWTLIGWGVAMAWACKDARPADSSIGAPTVEDPQRLPTHEGSDARIEVIAKLADLRDRGALTQEEFDREKEKVLSREDAGKG